MSILDNKGAVGSRAMTAIVQMRDDSGCIEQGGGRREKMKPQGLIG